jgi:hypothetical protein
VIPRIARLRSSSRWSESVASTRVTPDESPRCPVRMVRGATSRLCYAAHFSHSLFLFPSRPGASPSGKFMLAGLALVWMSWGTRQIKLARAWKRQQQQQQRPNQTLQLIAGRRTGSLNDEL